MYGKFQDFLKAEIQSIKDAGLYKTERLIATSGCRNQTDYGRNRIELLCEQLFGSFFPPASNRRSQESIGCPGIRHVVCSFHLRYPGDSQRAGS